MKALIVDDEARVRKAVRLLVDWDAHQIGEIMEAGSGNEAIELIREHKPGLVIMDMMMESGSGIELMTWVNEFAGSTKFIVVSGHNDFDFVRETVRHGGLTIFSSLLSRRPSIRLSPRRLPPGDPRRKNAASSSGRASV